MSNPNTGYNNTNKQQSKASYTTPSSQQGSYSSRGGSSRGGGRGTYQGSHDSNRGGRGGGRGGRGRGTYPQHTEGVQYHGENGTPSTQQQPQQPYTPSVKSTASDDGLRIARTASAPPTTGEHVRKYFDLF